MNVTVIIPIYNQFELTKRCVESVLRNTPTDVRIVLADDASTDPRIEPLLLGYERAHCPRVACESNVGDNAGFGATVNRVISAVVGDVIVLNSDTEVPPGWVERLHAVAYGGHHERVAAVCPLSNYATIFSVPNPGSNTLPLWLSTDEMDRLVQRHTDHEYPEVPTIMGFCMYLRREALDVIGGFDPAYGKGYGEEVDWCLRARKAGFSCVLADDVFVWHKGQASFGDSSERKELRENAIRILDARFPEYRGEITEWYKQSHLRALRCRLFDALVPRPLGEPRKPIKLHVLHSWGTVGGTEIVVRRQILADAEYEHVVCTPRFPHGSDGGIERDADGVTVIRMSPELCEAPLKVRGYPWGSDTAALVEHWFRCVLTAVGPTVVRFEHFAGWGTFVLPFQARDFGAHVEIVVHDEHMLCPVFRRGGDCTKVRCDASEECLACVKSKAQFLRSTHDAQVSDALGKWSGIWRYALGYADSVEAPSLSIAMRVQEATKFEGDIAVKSHARPYVLAAGTREPHTRLRVAYVGLASAEKGWDAFAGAARLLREDERFEFSVIGYVDPQCSREGLEHVAFHGAYAQGDLGSWLQRIDIAVPAVMRSESYGLIVDECVDAGCLVALPTLGVFCERIDRLSRVRWYTWGDGVMLAQQFVADAQELGVE